MAFVADTPEVGGGRILTGNSVMNGRRKAIRGGLAVFGMLLAMAGCDSQRISELEEGVATEADVRARFGAPETIWDEPGGSRVLEYNRQQAGQRN